jgi:hypothetical protein
MKIIMEVPQKLARELPHEPLYIPGNIYLKETESAYNKDTFILIFTAALFTIAKLWNQPRCLSTDKWIKKMWYMCTHWCFIPP